MANVTYTVANKNGSYDGDMVIKEYTTMAIDAGDTVTTDQPCRGLFIYCQGNAVINGLLSMNARGAKGNPASSGGSDSNATDSNGLRLGFFTSGGSESLTNDGTGFNGCGTAVRTAVANQPNLVGNGTIYSIPRGGASGGSGTNSSPYRNHASAGAISSNAATTGGGGTGAASGNFSNRGGNGTAGTCFAGGSGGGGSHNQNQGSDAATYAGAGGNGSGTGDSAGAGNPGGDSNNIHGQDGDDGNGGIIWLVIGGTLSGSGTISANGTNGGNFANNSCGGGGGTGGGVVNVFVKGSTSGWSGTIQATGGRGDDNFAASQGGVGGGNSREGGNGGNGTTRLVAIS